MISTFFIVLSYNLIKTHIQLKRIQLFETKNNSVFNQKDIPKHNDNIQDYFNSFCIQFVNVEELLLIIYISIDNHPTCILDTERKQFSDYNKNKNGIVDEDAIMSGNREHLLQFYKKDEKQNDLYLLIGDSKLRPIYFNVSYEIYSFAGQFNCTNNCSQNGICNKNNKCQCEANYFGLYCQFQSHKVSFSDYYNVEIDPLNWFYFSVHINEIDQSFLSIEVTNLKFQIKIAFGYNGIQDKQIPSLIQNVFSLNPDTSVSSETYSLNQQLYQYKLDAQSKVIMKEQILRIGFLNIEKEKKLKFGLKFNDKSITQLEQFMQENYIGLIAIVLIIFIGCLLIFCNHLTNQQRRVNQEVLQTEENEFSPIKQKVRRGFRVKFIDKYFPPYEYDEIVKQYPLLNEVKECVICLELMNEESKNQKEQVELMYDNEACIYCSVTPCFHMFHHHCLRKWFLHQKYCPMCREMYNEHQISNMKQWLDINQQMDDNKDKMSFRKKSNYIKKIKESKGNIQYNSLNEQNFVTLKTKQSSQNQENLIGTLYTEGIYQRESSHRN